MISNDLEIQLVGLERQTSLLTRLVPISIAVAVVSQMLVAQYVGQPGGAFQLVFIPRSFGSSSYCLWGWSSRKCRACSCARINRIFWTGDNQLKAAERLGLRPTASHSGETAGTAAADVMLFRCLGVARKHLR